MGYQSQTWMSNWTELNWKEKGYAWNFTCDCHWEVRLWENFLVGQVEQKVFSHKISIIIGLELKTLAMPLKNYITFISLCYSSFIWGMGIMLIVSVLTDRKMSVTDKKNNINKVQIFNLQWGYVPTRKSVINWKYLKSKIHLIHLIYLTS